MRAPLVLALLVVSSLVAGCLGQTPASTTSLEDGGPVEDALHELGEVLEAWIDVDGGVQLHGTLYLPEVAAETKVPVIMDMGPYYGQILGRETHEYDADSPPSSLYAHFLERGYAIALVSVRGTGLSGGCFQIGGPQERADVAAAVEWLAAQAWSNGAVGMTGVSYDGTTPWEGLVSGAAPHLKAIVPVEGISDMYRYSFYEGVPVGGGASFNTYYNVLVDATYTSAANAPAWLRTLASHACPEQAEVYAEPYKTYLDGVHGAFWDERDTSAMLDAATAPVFVVHGTKDFNVKMDHAQTLWGKLPPGSRMLLGQWEHNIPWRNSYDENLSWHAYNETILQFFDAHLKGDPVALAAEQAAPPVLVQDSANVTWNLTAWPPVESAPTAYGLGADGALVEGAGEAGEATLRANPAAQYGPDVAGIRPVAPDRLELATDALRGDMRLLGNPWIELNLSVDRPEGSLQAELYVEHADGERELVSMGWQNLATRTSRDQAEPVPTGETMGVRILLLGIAEHVEAGERLVLVLSPDATATLTPPLSATTYTLALGGESARLWLPVFAPGAPAPNA